MKKQDFWEPRGFLRILIRHIINESALSKDFTRFCDKNCNNRPQAMVNENIAKIEIDYC